MAPKTAAQFMKAVKTLAENNESFDIESFNLPYSIEDFENQSLSAADIKSLRSIFGIEIEDGESEIVGIFPDAINDLYEYGYDEDDDSDADYDDEY